jgi:pimeloyl-ACP methyl ester carboxylesterase
MSHKITFRERGQGPILLLLHGYGGTVHHVEGCAIELAKNYRVVVPNLSHLFMSVDRIFFSVQIEIIAEFIKTHFPDQKVHVAGLSFGGALSWGLAYRHPELVQKTILINPMVVDPARAFSLPELRYFFAVPLNTKAIYVLLLTPLGRGFLKRAAVIFRGENAEGSGRLDNAKGRKLLFVAQLIQNFAWILRNEDWGWWKKKLASAPLNALLIFDREDPLFRKEVYLKFANTVRCMNVQEMTGAGHLATKSRPESIAKSIHDFLSAVEAPSIEAPRTTDAPLDPNDGKVA